MTLTARTTRRFVCFLCALASLTQLVLGCPQNFLDIIGPGVRVKRGPDWNWGNQDGNGLGTVMTEISSTSWISVKWDNGHTNSYRVGHQSKCDLAIVDILDTQCNLFPTNMTNTGDFLLSYQDFPRPVHAQYRCHKHIQSPDETKVVALHILMIDICNTSIYDGANSTSRLMARGCMMIPGTFVSSGRDMFLETFKELGTKYGFMAYITYEDIECENMKYISVEKDSSGIINSPYSNYTLSSSIRCLWKIQAPDDQVLELTVTFLDEERTLSVKEEESGTTTTISFSKKPVGYLTSKTSKVTIIYEKFRRFGKGFQIVYKSKDKPKKAFCPELYKTLEHGEREIITVPTYNPESTGTLRCKWYLNAKHHLSLIQLTVTRIESVDCQLHNDIFTANGVSFPRKGRCKANSFSLTAKEFNISYIAYSPNNSVIILEYQTIKVPFCFENETISVDKERTFLIVPNASLFTMKSPCEWNLVSPENQQVSVEIIPQTEYGWEPYNAFLYYDGKRWTNTTQNKITSNGNILHLRYDISKQPRDFSGKVILTYQAVPPPMTPALNMVVSSTLSTQPVECKQPGVPIWCYVVLVLLSIACVALFITTVTFYRRQIYVCDEHGSLLNLRLQDIIAKDDHI